MRRNDLGRRGKVGMLILIFAFISFPISPSIALAEEKGATNTSGTKEEAPVAGTESAAGLPAGSETAEGGNAGDGGTVGLSPVAIGGIAAGVLAITIIAIAASSSGGGGGGGGSTTPPTHNSK